MEPADGRVLANRFSLSRATTIPVSPTGLDGSEKVFCHSTIDSPTITVFVTMRTFVIVSVLSLLASNPAEAWTPSRPPVGNQQTRTSLEFSHSTVRPSTELSLKLKNIVGKIRKRIRHNDPEDDFATETLEEEADQDLASPFPSSPAPAVDYEMSDSSELKADGARAPVRMGEDPKSKEINVNMLDQQESVQERINRVKAGKMTPEEKEAFLKAALSTGNTPETRLPLRQPLPINDMDDVQSNASPFPEDPILRSIAGGKEPAAAKLSKQLIDKVGIDSQKKKREYLEMVTDPHRFDVFRKRPSSARLNPSSPASGRISGDPSLEETQQTPDQVDTTISSDMESVMDTKSLEKDSSEIPSETPKDKIAPSSDLADRLEAAAIVQEQQRKQQEEEKQRLALEAKEKKRQAAAKAEEEERRRQEILTQREMEYRERRRLEEEEAARESAKMKEEEAKRLKALMDAQDSYWQKQLAKERELRKKELDDKPKSPPAPAKKSESVVPSPVQAPVAASPPAPTPKSIGSSRSLGNENLSKHVFNPDERNILNDTDSQVSKSANSAPVPSPSRPLGSFLNDVPTVRSEDTRKRAADRRSKKNEVMDEQLRRLKELNSPLPNIPPQGRHEYHKKTSPVSFEPQKPVKSYSTPKPPVNANSDRITQNDITSPKKVESSAPAPSGFKPPPTAPSADTAGSNPLNKLFNTQTTPSPAPVQAKPSIPKPEPTSSPERTGPIRMKLPLQDDNDFDEEEGIDAGANQNMSIKDALKKSGSSSDVDQEERSKKWYVHDNVDSLANTWRFSHFL